MSSHIYNKDGEQIGLYEICQWWILTYPEDVFKTTPEPIVKIREQAKILLNINKTNLPPRADNLGGCPAGIKLDDK